VTYDTVTDEQALAAFCLLAELEGIIPALETAHAVAGAVELARSMDPAHRVLINLSGRGDKDVEEAARLLARSPGEDQ
jgi:tryptophan synthase beta chain